MPVRRPSRDPLADIELPPVLPGTFANDPANPGSSTIVRTAIERENRQRAALRSEGGDGGGASVATLRVRRPKGNTRGPLPGQGANQGTGVPDTADRSNQGGARSGITGAGTGRRLSTIGSTPGENPKAESGSIKLGTDNTKPATEPSGVADDEATYIDGSEVAESQIFQSLAQTHPFVESVLQDIAQGTFIDAKAANVIDPNTFLPTADFQMPSVNGQQVFYGQDIVGNEGYGYVDEEGFFVLADGAIQNEAAGKAAAIAAARQFFIGTDEATRTQNLSLLSEQVKSFLVGQREQAGRDFEADQAERDRQFQEYIANLNADLTARRDERNNAFTAHQNNIDRALQTARDDRDFALRSADFELAQRRFQQETQLQNAQFALSLFQSISANPEMLYGLQASGLIDQFAQIIPGLDLGAMFPGLDGAEATSQLAQADLPALRDLQAMPADQQTQVLTAIAIRTGVKRETIVAEIQRRASGQGLAGGREQLARVPA